MAVYTEVSDAELIDFLKTYDIGGLVSCKGIAEGVENSNFLLLTDQGPFILTLYEKRIDAKELPFFLGLKEHLASKGMKCPVPIHNMMGDALSEIAGRPAAIISFLKGMWVKRPTNRHCALVGSAMAQMHLAADDYNLSRQNSLSEPAWFPLFEASKKRVDEVQKGLGKIIGDELTFLHQNWPENLPRGIIHADLFPDNVFFHQDELSGLIDFYFACNDQLVYDLAIGINAWCFESDGAMNVTKAKALISGYQKVRALSPEEIEALPIVTRGASLRFLLTRLYDWLHVPEGAFVQPKDPMEYVKKLRFHQQVKSAAEYGIYQ